jgi:hypothetical protein
MRRPGYVGLHAPEIAVPGLAVTPRLIHVRVIASWLANDRVAADGSRLVFLGVELAQGGKSVVDRPPAVHGVPLCAL